MSAFSALFCSPRARWAALMLALSVPVASYGQTQDAPPEKEISSRVSEQLGKLRELTDAENYDGALQLINELMRTADPDTYDMTVLAQVKAQVLLTQEKYEASIEPLELALRLGETRGFLERNQIQEYTMLLSQLHFQVAAAHKEREKQIPGLDRAIGYLRRYLEMAEQPRPEARLFAAQAFYQRATMDEDNVDRELLQQARIQAENGLYDAIKPRETFYVIILAIIQTEGRNEEAAELLELLVKQYPTNRQYWQQLAFTYLALAEEHRNDPEREYELNIRTITAIERAQQLGIMDTPRDHFNLIGIYFNIQRFDEAVQLLERGLQNGNIEDTQRNWELLASSYQQVRKELKAIDVLKEATRRFPEAGSLEYTIAQTYYSINKLDEAYRHALAALEKANLDKPSAVQLFAAYLGYELGKYEEALTYAEEASKDPEAENADRLVSAIREMIEERELALKAQVF